MLAYELQPREGFDSLTAVDRARPVLQPHDVRVRVRAVSLNFRDLTLARIAQRRRHTVVPASDGAGEVIEVGSAVTRFKGGERVAAGFFPDWIDGEFQGAYHARALGGTADGMLAEEVVLEEQAWVVLPEHLSFEEGATLPCAGVTAYNALFVSSRVAPGCDLLAQGTGGVSIFSLQLGKSAGARVIVTSRSESKRERARQLGADQTIDYEAMPKWGEEAYAWTGGRGVDVVVEVGGPGTFDQSVAALRFGGTMALIGVLTGGRGEVNTAAVFHKSLHVRGIYVGSRRMFEGLNRALSVSQIRPVIDKVFEFSAARAAYEYLASGAHFGKVVLRVP